MRIERPSATNATGSELGARRPGTGLGAGELIGAFRADLAQTEAERRRGLRGREPLQADEALLIELPRELDVCVVNDGVEFAIDAVYARATGEIVAVMRDIPAGDGEGRCQEQVYWILETAAGLTAPVQPGDRLYVDD